MSTETILEDLGVAISACEDTIWELDNRYGEYAPDEVTAEGTRLLRSIGTLERLRDSLK